MALCCSSRLRLTRFRRYVQSPNYGGCRTTSQRVLGRETNGVGLRNESTFSTSTRCRRRLAVVTSFDHYQRGFSSTSSSEKIPVWMALPSTDFFGEPMTSLAVRNISAVDVSLVERLDACILATCTAGQTCPKGGGDTEGVNIKAAHSTAIVWVELLRAVAADPTSWAIPMVGVVAVAPMLVLSDISYVRLVDRMLAETSGDDNCLQVLQQCPGDALALSLAIQLASVLGDRKSAMAAAGTVSSYWRERHPPGIHVINAYISVACAMSGHVAQADALAQMSLSKDRVPSGAIVSWAFAHLCHWQGRSPEGIDYLALVGQENFDRAGWMGWDVRLLGYGARFFLDREGQQRQCLGTLRMFDQGYRRVLYHSGYSQKTPVAKPLKRVPVARVKQIATATRSFFGGWLGDVSEDDDQKQDVKKKQSRFDHADDATVKKDSQSIFSSFFGSDTKAEQEEITADVEEDQQDDNGERDAVDVFTYLPPSPLFVAEATVLLLRLGLHQAIQPDDERWVDLQNSWDVLLLTNRKDEKGQYELPPLILLTAALMGYQEIDLGRVPSDLKPPMNALRQFGRLFLQKYEHGLTDKELESQWKDVADLLSMDPTLLDCVLDLDAQPLLVHTLCYAAVQSKNQDCLLVARGLCSEALILRSNNPEEWYRYSLVLDALGDEAAAEQARAAAISMGSGEGINV